MQQTTAEQTTINKKEERHQILRFKSPLLRSSFSSSSSASISPPLLVEPLTSQQEQFQQNTTNAGTSSALVSVHFIQSLYHRNLAPLVLNEILSQQQFNHFHHGDKNKKQQEDSGGDEIESVKKHCANAKALVDQMIFDPTHTAAHSATTAASEESSSQKSMNQSDNRKKLQLEKQKSVQRLERSIARSRLLRPSFCNVTDVLISSSTPGAKKSSKMSIAAPQLSLAYFERAVQDERRAANSHLSLKKIEKKHHFQKLREQRREKQFSYTSSRRKMNQQATTNKRDNNKDAVNRTQLHLKQKQIASESFDQLHKLWRQYISSLGTISPDQHLKIDLHGAHMEVVRSSVPSLVGKQGIVMCETCNTFQIWTRDHLKNKNGTSVTIPKQKSVFSVRLDDQRTMTIFGDHFMYRAAERATKKFTRNDSIDL